MAWPPRNKEATMVGPTNQRDWAFLIPDIIDIILAKLTDSFTGFLHFISVCQRWRLLALEKDDKESDNRKKLEILRTCHNQLPLLVTESLVTNNTNRWFFTNIQSSSDGDGGYQLKKQLDGPSFYYCGSSFGWLIARQVQSPIPQIVLFNPLSSAVKHLPPPDVQQYIGNCCKAVLSSDPSIEGDYELVVIHSAHTILACYRSSTNSWMDMRGRFVDAVFYGGKICAITAMGNLLQVNFDTGHTQVVVHWNQICYYIDDELTPYLVVSNEGHDLLMVKQRGLKKFEVLKLCCAGEVWTWVEINNLGGDQALFVGRNCYYTSCFSACVSTLEFPQCQSNCIYYTWGARYPGSEQRGVFDMELKQHFESPPICTAAGPLSSQIWMVPNLKGS